MTEMKNNGMTFHLNTWEETEETLVNIRGLKRDTFEHKTAIAYAAKHHGKSVENPMLIGAMVATWLDPDWRINSEYFWFPSELCADGFIDEMQQLTMI